MIDIEEEFSPIIQKYHYMDSTATSLTPKRVIDAVKEYYSKYNANIHRGIYKISERATEEYERARDKIAKFTNSNREQVIFTRNTTESINLVATVLERSNTLGKGDLILVSEMEHHSNIVPWQMLEEKGIRVEYVKVNEDNEIDLSDYESKLELNPKVVSMAYVSNVLGTINPIHEVIKKARERGAITVVDAAQSAPHIKTDYKGINADFIAFSGHKMLGPTGIGVLLGNKKLLEELPPYQGGGSMIRDVRKEGFIPSELPQKYEAGTPNIAGAIGLGVAVEMLEEIGFEKIEIIERELLKQLYDGIEDLRLEIISQKNIDKSVGIFTFNVPNMSPFEVATIADEHNIFLRAGHHCAQIIHRKKGVEGSVRASLYLYNKEEDINALLDLLKEISN